MLIKNIFTYLYFVLLILLSIFSRSFAGLYISQFRLGELLIGGALVSYLIFFIFGRSKILKLVPNFLIVNQLKIIFFSTFFLLVFNSTKDFDLGSIRRSSYVWTLIFLLFGAYLLKDLDKPIQSYIFAINLVALYLFSYGYYPNFIIDFFKQFSDKFDFIKASDIFLSLLVANQIVIRSGFNKKISLVFTIFSSFAFLPYFISQSRGSTLACLVFMFIFLYEMRNTLIKYKIFTFITLIGGLIIFIFSTLLITQRIENNLVFEGNFQNEIVVAVDDNLKNKNIKEGFFGFYLQDGRLMSKDNTTNWRLDIWQDLFWDLNSNGNILIGYGFDSIFPVMLDPTAPGRLGRDGLNENVHNYFVNILGRGGLLQLILFIILYFTIIKNWMKIESKAMIFSYLIPVLIVSSLDVTMEGVQFPIIFYSYLGLFAYSD
tara:strand:+ start:312 stop:1604 length:1293 start_codon:yes stop_codon:yes gene_type:complete